MVVRCPRGKPRFRFQKKRTKTGKRVRLAFCGNKVVERKVINKRKKRSKPKNQFTGSIYPS